MAVVLKRKVGESLRIGDNIRITIRELHRGNVRLVIEAPQGTLVLRSEVEERENDNGKTPDRDSDETS